MNECSTFLIWELTSLMINISWASCGLDDKSRDCCNCDFKRSEQLFNSLTSVAFFYWINCAKRSSSSSHLIRKHATNAFDLDVQSGLKVIRFCGSNRMLMSRWVNKSISLYSSRHFKKESSDDDDDENIRRWRKEGKKLIFISARHESFLYLLLHFTISCKTIAIFKVKLAHSFFFSKNHFAFLKKCVREREENAMKRRRDYNWKSRYVKSRKFERQRVKLKLF